LPPLRLEAGDTLTLMLRFSPPQARTDPLPPVPPGSVRGVISFLPAAPLWAIDGVPQLPADARVVPDLNSWAPDLSNTHVARIELLRGAAAASLYGSRAVGGVFAVTTRKR